MFQGLSVLFFLLTRNSLLAVVSISFLFTSLYSRSDLCMVLASTAFKSTHFSSHFSQESIRSCPKRGKYQRSTDYGLSGQFMIHTTTFNRHFTGPTGLTGPRDKLGYHSVPRTCNYILPTGLYLGFLARGSTTWIFCADNLYTFRTGKCNSIGPPRTSHCRVHI